MVDFNMTFVAQIVNFLFLVWVLAKFAYKPLMKMMEERKNKIASDLSGAETARADAEKVKAEADAALTQARQEAAAIVEAARANAQTAAEKIMADANAAKDALLAQGREEVAIEKKKALEEVRAQVIELSMVAAGKIIEKKLGTADDKKMAAEIVDSILK
ncbi:MAG: F0F1 ATP synthase subunit B [Phascolarctobacterium sp.]|nr:F0F1 ATP synthase subunit B [Candidatus Phascolarctobacterium equi]